MLSSAFIFYQLWLCRSKDESSTCYMHREISMETGCTDDVTLTSVFRYDWLPYLV